MPNPTLVSRVSLAAAIASLAQPPAVLDARQFAPHPAARAAARPPVPVECATKNAIRPKTPGWAFVVNFERTDASGQPIGCLMLFRTVLFPTDFALQPCKVIGTTAEFFATKGQGIFTGGYLLCEVNVQATLAAFTPTVVVSDTEQYSYFTIVGVGRFNEAPVNNFSEYGNPIGYYRPNAVDKPDLGLFMPLSPNGGNILSRFNGTDNKGAFANASIYSIGVPYTITVEHDGIAPEPGSTQTGTLTTTHYLNDIGVRDVFAPRSPVTFATNGGTFWIGASPLDPSPNTRLRGVFEEVIFDPPDGGRPPTRTSVSVLDVYMPIALRAGTDNRR